MKSASNSYTQDKTLLQRVQEEISYLPSEFRNKRRELYLKHPFKLLAIEAGAGLALTAVTVAGVLTGPSKLHENYIHQQASKVVAAGGREPLNLSVLWVKHSGQAVGGYAQIAQPQSEADREINTLLKSSASAKCVTIDMKYQSGILGFMFKDTVKATNYKTNGFDSDKYVCAAVTSPRSDAAVSALKLV